MPDIPISGDVKLSDLLQVNESGKILFHDHRLLVFDADALGLLRRELIESLGAERARRILTRFGFAHGYRDAVVFHQLMQGPTDREWLAMGPRMAGLKGIVHSTLMHLEIDKVRGVFESESRWDDSFEAEQHVKQCGMSSEHGCWALTGYASGFCTAVFGSPVFFMETSCKARGDETCYGIGRAEGRMPEEMRQQLAYFQGEDFDADVKRLQAEQAAQAEELARQQKEVRKLESRVLLLNQVMQEQLDDHPMIGQSASIRNVMDQAHRVADSDATVLISGETGTGKDVLARIIHSKSHRRQMPLVTVNCAALPDTLVESELFGHEKGAFTGASQRKPGRFELADGATLFLDEIGELPLDMQSKLLRVLQQGEIEPLGGTRTVKVDVRILAATNRSLEQMVADGKFRADLFYRLNVVPLSLPPLRERREDVAPLVEHFVHRFRRKFQKPIEAISPASLESLQNYAWPGNIRELEHVIERAVLLSGGDVLVVDLPPDNKSDPSAEELGLRLLTLEDLQKQHIESVLRHTNGVLEGKTGAAAILGINPSTLRSRMKKLGLR